MVATAAVQKNEGRALRRLLPLPLRDPSSTRLVVPRLSIIIILFDHYHYHYYFVKFSDRS